MHEDAGRGVRTKKDSSLLRAAEAVRDGRAAAMVSAGNTGATMASALLRMGRIKGVNRPAIATPVPVPGDGPPHRAARRRGQRRVQPGHARAVRPDGVRVARRALRDRTNRSWVCSPSAKRTPRAVRWSKKPMRCWLVARRAPTFNFVGNVEGRDVTCDQVDVIVTDGFTGNVVLKTLEGALAVPDGRPDRDPRPARGGRRPPSVLLPAPAARWPPSSTPRPPAAPCCSAWTGCASSATARRRRWPWSTPSPWPTTWPSTASSTRSPPRSRVDAHRAHAAEDAR